MTELAPVAPVSYLRRVRARYAPPTALFLMMVAAAACSSASSHSPHPALVVDCQPPPVSSVTGPHCPGICLQHDHCDGAGPVCPAGFQSVGNYGCANAALCCVFGGDGGDEGGLAEAGADGGGDTGSDAADARDAAVD